MTKLVNGRIPSLFTRSADTQDKCLIYLTSFNTLLLHNEYIAQEEVSQLKCLFLQCGLILHQLAMLKGEKWDKVKGKLGYFLRVCPA